jgi:cephalosporin hydroxylase
MREYWKQIGGDMFDFATFYTWIVTQLQPNPRLMEVGVADGKSLIFLTETLLNRGLPFEMKGCDSLAYGAANQHSEILRNMTLAGVADKVQFIPMDSLNASCKYPDEYFHFIFLDSSHDHEATKAEIRLWWRKLMPDGILGGHDFFSHEGVQRAVKEIIPGEFLKSQATDKGNGVWWVRKSGGAYVN